MSPISNHKTIILANGTFPTHPFPLSLLFKAKVVVCCDGAAQQLLSWGRDPDLITGDMDSLPQNLIKRFKDRIVPSSCQETNDLTKAVRLSIQKGFHRVHILGATGGREDHTLANISLLADYAQLLQVDMITDHGIFIPLLSSGSIDTQPGMQISIFSLTPDISLQASGLKYPISDVRFDSWWKGSLNEATETQCDFVFESGRIILFLEHSAFPNASVPKKNGSYFPTLNNKKYRR